MVWSGEIAPLKVDELKQLIDWVEETRIEVYRKVVSEDALELLEELGFQQVGKGVWRKGKLEVTLGRGVLCIKVRE